MPRSAPLAATTAIAALALLLLAPPPAAPAASRYFRATLTAPTHTPKAGRPWPIVVTARFKGKGVRASLRYQFLFAGQIVARRSHYVFTGRFRDRTFVWPASAAGIRLTFRAVVSSRYGTRNLDYWVKVRR